MTVRQASNHLTGGHLAILAVGTFTLGVDGFVLAGLLPQVAADLHVSAAIAGQLTTAFALTYALASPVIATVTGRLDRRLLLWGGMAVFVLGMLGQAFGATFTIVLLARVVAAIGAAAFQANAYAMAGLLSTPENRPRSLAAVATGSSLAVVAGVPFGVLVGQHWGWRTAVWVLVVLALVSAAAVSLLPPAFTPPTSMSARLSVLARPTVLVVLLGTVVALVPFFGMLAYLPPLLGRAGWAVVAATAACGLGQAAGLRVVPRVVLRFGAVRTVVGGALAIAVVLAAVAVARSELVLVLVLLLVLGVCSASAIVPQQNRFFVLVPDVAVVALGLNGSAIYLGSAAGGALGGAVLGYAGAGWLAPAGALVAVVAALVVGFGAPERRGAGSRSAAAH